jgi:hypothetical protein
MAQFPKFHTGVQVTKSDSVGYSPALAGLYVGGTGDVTVVTKDGVTLLFSAVPIGVTIELAIAKVMATGTTATLMTGLM